MTLEDILRKAMSLNASDIHLKHGLMPIVRIHGELYPLSTQLPKLKSEQIDEMLIPLMKEEQKENYLQNKELDMGYGISGVGRFRINIFKQRDTTRAVIRPIPMDVPALETLGLPEVVKKIAQYERGLVLVTGVTGSGKSTTLASMINEINRNHHKHILTIEDPIEYLIRDKKSIITQREVGADTPSFAHALRAGLRQDPDVILIGEMRDRETIETALLAAETGHLVLSTLHSTDTRETIQRILAAFDDSHQKQIRMQLSTSLRAVISQRLVRTKNKKGFTPAVEILINNARTSELIAVAEKTRDLYNAIEDGHLTTGMQSFDQSLMDLVTRNVVDIEEAKAYASNTDDFELRLKGVMGSDNKKWTQFDQDAGNTNMWAGVASLEVDKESSKEKSTDTKDPKDSTKEIGAEIASRKR